MGRGMQMCGCNSVDVGGQRGSCVLHWECAPMGESKSTGRGMQMCGCDLADVGGLRGSCVLHCECASMGES
eukprot:2564475-Pleurochrysis_carterae.AAC.1